MQGYIGMVDVRNFGPVICLEIYKQEILDRFKGGLAYLWGNYTPEGNNLEDV